MRTFTEEQNMFRDAYRKFLEAEIVPNMEKWQEQGIVDREAFKKAGDQGFLMIWPDEQYGGLGDSDFRFEQIIMEETHRVGCASWLNTLCLYDVSGFLLALSRLVFLITQSPPVSRCLAVY
jgi:acyl-CoA dehydrogenase